MLYSLANGFCNTFLAGPQHKKAVVFILHPFKLVGAKAALGGFFIVRPYFFNINAYRAVGGAKQHPLTAVGDIKFYMLVAGLSMLVICNLLITCNVAVFAQQQPCGNAAQAVLFKPVGKRFFLALGRYKRKRRSFGGADIIYVYCVNR